MKTMIVFSGEKKMHCGTNRKKKMGGGRMNYGMGSKVKKDGNAAARRESYRSGSMAMSKAMPKCMPN